MKHVRVIKLGGSLLIVPRLREKFHRWCNENPHPCTFVVVGGGGIVEAVRTIDRANSIPEAFAHRTCIDLMQHTARLARQILDIQILESRIEIESTMSCPSVDSDTPIMAIAQIGDSVVSESSRLGLPESWEVTSDTLAAAFSLMISAEELVVMKSLDVPNNLSIYDVAKRGIVDPVFTKFAERIGRVRFVNLRKY